MVKEDLEKIKPRLKNYLLSKNYSKFLNLLTNTCLPFNCPKTKYDRTVFTPYKLHNIFKLPTYVNYSLIDTKYIAASLPRFTEDKKSFKILLTKMDLIISCIHNPNYIDEILYSKSYFFNGKLIFYDEIIQVNANKLRLFRFANWIDHDVLDLQEFEFWYDFYKKNKFNKILVHCEAGVGRTGTLIAYDILSQYKHVDIDIFVDIICRLREQRNGMVYSVKQLKFLIDKFIVI